MTLGEVLLLMETMLTLQGKRRRENVAAALQQIKGDLETGRDTRSVTFREAVEASLLARSHCRPSTRSDLRSYTRRMLNFEPLADTPLQRVDIHLCKRLMEECFKPSPHVRRKAQSVLHSVFAYAIRHGWCTHNPAEGIDLQPAVEQEVRPLTIPQIRRLLQCCRLPQFRAMDAPVRLMLWCGIRPGEVQRLRWCDIDPKEGVVYIAPQHSKTGGARMVRLRGAALTLLRSDRPDLQPLAPKSWNKRWAELRRQARLQPWQQDTLRHSFASYHLKYFHNIVHLQEDMGHRDTSLLRTRYLNLRSISTEDADTFFNKLC